MSNREPLMMRGDATHCLTDHEADASADARVYLVEDERRHMIEPREDRLQRQHDPRQLSPRRDAREGAFLMSNVERDTEFDVFRATWPGLGERLQTHRKMAVRHAEVGKNLIDATRQALRRGATQVAERRRALLETRLCLSLARLELAKIESCGVHEIELLASATARLDDLRYRRPVLLR